MSFDDGAVSSTFELVPLVSMGAGNGVPEVSALDAVVIWVNGIESPLPLPSAPLAVALSVTLPLLLTMAAVSTPPERSPPVPATAVPLPTVPAAGEKVIRSMVLTDVSAPEEYAEPVQTRK